MAKKTKEQRFEERETLRKERIINSELDNLRFDIKHGKIPTDPTYIHNVGDMVIFGAHQNTQILEVYENNLIYKIKSYGTRKEYGIPKPYEQFNIISWVDVRKKTKQTTKSFKSTGDIIINFSNSSLDSLLHKIYSSGVDFNPEYQRGLVWELEDKVALIDSIFNNIEIGKFAFIQRDFKHDIFYEILDGKQRLTAIREFYENRFTYKGLTFDELQNKDKHHFTGFPVVMGYTKEPKDRKAIYRYFIKLNTSGKPMDDKHLNKIKELAK
jgi:hypothetical protein